MLRWAFALLLAGLLARWIIWGSPSPWQVIAGAGFVILAICAAAQK